MDDKIEQQLRTLNIPVVKETDVSVVGKEKDVTFAVDVPPESRGPVPLALCDLPVEIEEKPHPVSRTEKHMNSFSKRIIREARAEKQMLPHELLLYWANGADLGGFKPTPSQQIYAAIAAAPYYAPKLANIEVKQDVRMRAVISAQPMDQTTWVKKYLQTGDVTPVAEVPAVPSTTELETAEFKDDDDDSTL